MGQATGERQCWDSARRQTLSCTRLRRFCPGVETGDDSSDMSSPGKSTACPRQLSSSVFPFFFSSGSHALVCVQAGCWRGCTSTRGSGGPNLLSTGNEDCAANGDPMAHVHKVWMSNNLAAGAVQRCWEQAGKLWLDQ